jgi:hypothetical protein
MHNLVLLTATTYDNVADVFSNTLVQSALKGILTGMLGAAAQIMPVAIMCLGVRKAWTFAMGLIHSV